MRQRIVWEVVDNDGESLYLGMSVTDAFQGYMSDREPGVRLVKYRGATLEDLRIVGLFERGNYGRLVSLDLDDDCEECSKHTSGECVECQQITEGA